MSSNSVLERVFKGQFTITRGEPYNPKFERQKSDEFASAARRYRSKLNKLYQSSNFERSFTSSEIIALEKAKEGADDLVLHFNLHFNPRVNPDLNAADLYLVLANEIANPRYKLFSNVSIDASSLDITERREYPIHRTGFVTHPNGLGGGSYYADPWEARTRFPGLLEGLSTEATPPVRKCSKIGLNFCKALPYNETSYPNLVNHWNLTSLESQLISYRQIVDAECYPLAYEFVCLMIQPECVGEDELVYPCRDFCVEFVKNCSNWIPDKIKELIKCSEMPRFNGDDGADEEEELRRGKNSAEGEELDKVRKNSKREKKKCRRKPLTSI